MPATPTELFGGFIEEGQDQDGTRNGDPPRATMLRRVAALQNHCAAQGRTLMSLSIEMANSPSANGVDQSMFRYRFDEANLNGKRLRYVALMLPKDATLDQLDPVISDNGTTVVTGGGEETLADIANPDDIIEVTGELTLAPSDAETDHHIEVDSGMRLIGLCIVESPGDWPITFTGTDHHVDPGGFRTGARIVSPAAAPHGLVDIRETQEECFHRQRDLVNYCRPQPGNISLAMSETAAAFTNLLDSTSVARTTDTIGIPMSSLYGGYGTNTVVEAHVAVYASYTGGGSGEVRFESSQGSTDATAIAGAGWYTGAAKIDLDTRPAASSTDGRNWDKVDVSGRVVGGGTLYVWSIHIEIDPD